MSQQMKALPPSAVEPEIRQFVDVVTGDPMLAVKIPQFVSRDSNEMLWHTVRALDKLRNELIMRYWVSDSTL